MSRLCAIRQDKLIDEGIAAGSMQQLAAHPFGVAETPNLDFERQANLQQLPTRLVQTREICRSIDHKRKILHLWMFGGAQINGVHETPRPDARRHGARRFTDTDSPRYYSVNPQTVFIHSRRPSSYNPKVGRHTWTQGSRCVERRLCRRYQRHRLHQSQHLSSTSMTSLMATDVS